MSGGGISFCVTKTEDATAFFAIPHPVFGSVLRDLGRSVQRMFASCFFVANSRIRFLVSLFQSLTATRRGARQPAPRHPGTNPRCHCEFDHCHPLRSAIRCAHDPQSMLGNVRRDRLNTDQPAPMASGETIKALRQYPVVHDFLDRNRHQFTTLCERVLQVNGSAFRHRSHSTRFGETSTTQTINHPDD